MNNMHKSSIKLPNNFDLTFLFCFLCIILYLIVIAQFVIFQNGHSFTLNIDSDFFAETVDVIVNCLTAFIVLLGGTNAGRAFLKIGYLPEESDSTKADIPPWKTKQMFIFVIIIMLLEVVTLIFQLLSQTDKVNFYTKNITGVLAASILTYVAMRTTPKVAEGVFLKQPGEHITKTKINTNEES